MQRRRIGEIKATALFAFGILILASLASFTPEDLAFYTSHPNMPPHNLIRGFGAHLAGVLLFFIGWSSWSIPLFILFLSIRLFKQQSIDFRFVRIFGLIILILAISSLLAMFGDGLAWQQFSHGGLLGYIFSKQVVTYFGKLGAYIIFFTLTALSLALVFDILVFTFFVKTIQKIDSLLIKPLFRPKKIIFTKRLKPALKAKPKESEWPQGTSLSEPKAQPKITQAKPRIQIAKPKRQPAVASSEPVSKQPAADLIQEVKEPIQYQIPPLDLVED